MNKAKFDSLPEKAKAAIEKNSGEVLSRQFGKMSEDRNSELIAQWKKDPKRTVTELTPEQAAQLNKMFSPIVSSWVAKDDRNRTLLEALQKELATLRASN
jgi:TRAP-type C4-dicarboxylate transport system substrate-binding protein